MILEVPNDLSQFQRDARPRARVERIPPQQVIPDDEKIPSNDQEGDNPAQSQEMPGDDEIPCDEESGEIKFHYNLGQTMTKLLLIIKKKTSNYATRDAGR